MAVTNIYSLDCPITGNIRYIGKADDVNCRYRKHIEEAVRKKKNTVKNRWILSLNYKGLKPILNIVDSVPFDEWQFWECHYISLYKSFGFNLTNQTSGGDGGRMDKAVIEKMTLKKVGRTFTQEHKNNIRVKSLGNKHALGGTHRRKEVISYNIITGQINYHDSSYHASKDLCVLSSSIRNNICGINKVVNKKYIFFHGNS